MLYCPSCLNQTLDLNRKGVIHISINNIQMETGRILFNQDREEEEEIFNNCLKKIEDYFKWYRSFKNKEPIKKLQIMSSDFYCSNGCKIPMNMRFTIVGLLVPPEKVHEAISELAEKYGIPIDFTIEEAY